MTIHAKIHLFNFVSLICYLINYFFALLLLQYNNIRHLINSNITLYYFKYVFSHFWLILAHVLYSQCIINIQIKMSKLNKQT